MRASTRSSAAVCAAAVAISVATLAPAAAHASPAHCANLKLKVYDTGPVQPHGTLPVSHLTAEGLSCAQAAKVFSGARAEVTGGGGNQGVVWGLKTSPKGWTCRYITGYWLAKDHADTLDWIGGWSEKCTATGRTISFNEGKITPWHDPASKI